MPGRKTVAALRLDNQSPAVPGRSEFPAALRAAAAVLSPSLLYRSVGGRRPERSGPSHFIFAGLSGVAVPLLKIQSNAAKVRAATGAGSPARRSQRAGGLVRER